MVTLAITGFSGIDFYGGSIVKMEMKTTEEKPQEPDPQAGGLAEVKRLQKLIVKALEEGESTTKLVKELASVRARIAADLETEELRREVQHRRKLREKAEKVKQNVEAQAAAIDAFLQARDAVVEALKPALETAKDLIRLQSECHSHDYLHHASYPDNRPPEGYIPADLVLRKLQVADGTTGRDVRDTSAEAVQYLSWAIGLLSSLTAIEREIPTREPVGFEDLGDNGHGNL